MKNIWTAALICSLMMVYAFKPAGDFEGKIKYTIRYVSMPPEYEQMKSMLPNETTVYIKDKMTRTEQNSSMSEQAVIMNSENKSGTILYNIMGQKIAVKFNESNRPGAHDQKPVIKYLDETKVIAGYTCKKAEVTFEGESGTFNVFYTEEISGHLSGSIDGIKGFPLEYEIAHEEVVMRLTATELSKEKVSESLFVIPTEYKETTMENLEQMMGGGR